MSTKPAIYLTPASPQLSSYGTMEYAPHQDTMEYALCEDSHFDDSTIYESTIYDSYDSYDSDDSNDSNDSWTPYTGSPYLYYYERQDLKWQSPPFCHSVEDCWFIFSYAPIWLTVLVSLMAIVGFGFVAGFLVAVARSMD